MRMLVFLVLLAVTAPAVAQGVPAPVGGELIPGDSRLERLFTRTATLSGGLTEGPAVAPDGSIYFSDIPFGKEDGMILRFDPTTGRTTEFTARSRKSNGLIFAADGTLLACEGANYGGRCVARWNIQTGQRTVVVDRYEGQRFNAPNDLCLDAEGRIYFTDPRYVGHEPRELEHRAVYRIDQDGSVMRVTTAVSKPNGIAISPDGKTLYVADTDNGTDHIDPTAPPPPQGVMRVYAFPLDADGRVAGERRILVDFGDEAGCDGMTVDHQGNVVLTVRSVRRPGVMIVNPRGEQLAFIPTGPANQTTGPDQPAVGLPSNVEFGLGEDASTLYITVDTSLYRIRLNTRGDHVQYRRRGKP